MESSKGNTPVFWKVILMVLIAGCTVLAAGIPAIADSETETENTGPDGLVVMDVTVNPDRNANCLKTMEMGTVKIAVLGSSDIYVKAINPESLAVSSEKNDAIVRPVGYFYEDISEDGYEDLVLRMNCHEMMVKLRLRYCFCNKIPLTVSGELKDGSSEVKGTGTTVILPSLR